MSRETFSIALTTYNGARFLREQLRSFSAQSRPPDELVVCDDGSTDGTLDIVSAFADSADFEVRILRNPHTLGLSGNFEKVVASCRGDIIFMSDQDDVWEPRKLQEMGEVFAADPGCDVVIADQTICREDLTHEGVSILQNVAALGLTEDYFVAGCSTALRSSWREIALPLPGASIPYDTWINRLAAALGRRRVLRRPLQRYRRHGANDSSDVTSSVSLLSRRDLLAAYGGREQVLEGWAEERRDIEVFLRRIAEAAELLAARGLSDRARAATRELRTRSAALQRRSQVLEVPRPRRVAAAARLWSEGGYGHFQGARSALRDVSRADRPARSEASAP